MKNTLSKIIKWLPSVILSLFLVATSYASNIQLAYVVVNHGPHYNSVRYHHNYYRHCYSKCWWSHGYKHCKRVCN